MELNGINLIFDRRSQCYSIMTSTTMGAYLAFIRAAYDNMGGLPTQRDALKTSSAIRIRKRMITDISSGAVLPPIVLGLVISQEKFQQIAPRISVEDFDTLLNEISPEHIAIIDGMQRTTAIIEAGIENIRNNNLRIEFWIATNTNSLIYRMLILNTGQVPWSLRRQIEVMYRSLIEELTERVEHIRIIRIGEKERRKIPGEFQANDLIDLYVSFGARKEVIETKDRLADEFVRLDFIVATESSFTNTVFYHCLNYLGMIDKEFGRYEKSGQQQGEESSEPSNDERFSNGTDLFNSQPARTGFITALAKKIMGRPGNDKPIEEQSTMWDQINQELNAFTRHLAQLSEEQMGTFLALDVLNENISRKSGKVGQFEREFFTKAFDTLVDEKLSVSDLQVCWRAF